MFEVSEHEIETLAKNHGAFIERRVLSSDQDGRTEISWVQLAVRLPDDGTGTLPLLPQPPKCRKLDGTVLVREAFNGLVAPVCNNSLLDRRVGLHVEVERAQYAVLHLSYSNKLDCLTI
jgi:hypothetical protein